ncbi:hypothetical protein V6N13_020906 [Hibiscus sabdariffa]|uniref:Glycosyl transferase CAP10 domain-containing protein n=1 Tax=Hibiscus sabdariffa TaxID=183260 RepID=A0ABR2EUX9_9ROSI
MAEHVKIVRGVWPYGHGDEVIQGWLSKATGLGRLKGFVTTTTSFIFFFFLLVIAALIWLDFPIIRGNPFSFAPPSSKIHPEKKIHHVSIERIQFPLNCSSFVNYVTVFEPKGSTAETCPDYFRWIHQDLRPWKASGITKDMIERGIPSADFRLVIVNGNVYVERYRPSFQTRDLFTIWGILQLLKLYPGKVPDLELLFYCGDNTVIMKRDYEGPSAASPPPVFHYCGEKAALDIIFPDWSFWGWAEVNIKPWEETLRAIRKGAERIKWENREPYAYWKGAPTSTDRLDLLKCNLSDTDDWSVRVYEQDWGKEIGQGFKHSNLEDQCTHRYKIYAEGRTWSVSEKYIMACDSMTLMIQPEYYDFFSRSLVPAKHFWPIGRENKCGRLKFAVEWGNNHTRQAQAIGKAGSQFMEEMLAMRNVYDYMFHLLNEYSKLLKFKPTIPPNAQRVCAETTEQGLAKEFMLQSMVKSPSDKLPCALRPPFEPRAMQASLDVKQNNTRQVEMWEAGILER